MTISIAGYLDWWLAIPIFGVIILTRKALVSSEVWAKPDWRALSVDAQHLYVLLLSQPQITLCGVQPLMVAKWATLAKGWTVKAVDAALVELEQARFIVVDRDTFEVLIRSFMRHDGVMDSPNFAKGALSRALDVVSPKIQRALVGELERCTPKARKAEVLADVQQRLAATIAQLDAVSADYVEPVQDAAVVAVEAPKLEPATQAKAKRGTRLQEGWQPDNATIDKACSSYNITRQEAWNEHEAFENYWLSKSGANAVKLDWNRVWLNWMKKFGEQKGRGGSSNGGMTAREQRIMDAERFKVPEGQPQPGLQPALGVN